MERRLTGDVRETDRPGARPGFRRSESSSAEIISIGRELLLGRVEDSNAGTLARLLTMRGANVRRITTVGDAERAVADAVREAIERNPQLLILSGGLGPGTDDHTVAAVASALRLPLAVNHQAREMVEAAYQRLRKERLTHKGGLTAAREKMCTLPVGSSPVENPAGISPGVVYRIAGHTTVLCLPGLPDEAEAVFAIAAAELKLPASGAFVARREIESPTSDESSLHPMIARLQKEFPRVWVHSAPLDRRKPGTKVMISLEATGAGQQEANSKVDEVVRRLLALAAGSR
jgi:nicotinamide-nucleotide amidase